MAHRRVHAQTSRISLGCRLGVAAIALGGLLPGALAADPVWFADAVARLDDGSFAVREASFEQIVARPDLSLAEIEARLALGGLSPEQRLRLDRAALARFAAVPRAGLGVQFGVPITEVGVPLRVVIDGFPAAAFLRAEDVVLTIDGHPVNTTDDMGAIILSHEPGETLRMEIERAPEPGAGIAPGPDGPDGPRRLVLDVPLGSFGDLQGAAALTPDRLERAYRHYQSRVGVLDAARSTETVVGGQLAPLDWLRAEGYDHGAGAAPRGAFERVPAWRYISLAGQPQSWIAPVDLRRGDPNASMLRVSRGLQRNSTYDDTERLVAEYRTLLSRIAEITERLAAAAAGELPRFDPDRLAQLRVERDELNGELAGLAGELARVPLAE
jgi:hypothetical protein